MQLSNIRTLSVKPSRGFTLIEILAVMAIVALLAALVAPNIFRGTEGARRDAALAQIRSLQTMLDSHRLDVGRYPESLEGLMENEEDSAAWNGPYLRGQIPLDPWGNDYVYESDGREFSLVSYGPDGERGGEDDDADIGS